MAKKIKKITLPPLNVQWVSNLPPAFVSAIIITITSTAAISMIFKGDLSVYLPIGISCALIGAVIVNMISKYVCIFPFAVSSMTPNASVVMGLFLYELSTLGLSPEATFYTVFTAFILTCFITAIFLFLVGFFKIGKLIRYMPYPVLCGFFAGVGWYLFLGAMTIVGVDTKSLSLQSDFLSLSLVVLPSLIFALLAFMIQQKFKNPFSYIGFIGFGVIVFYIYLFTEGISMTQATTMDLTVQSTKIDFLFEHIDTSIFQHIHWWEILSRWGYIFSFAAVNLLSLLAYAVNFEETSHTSVDLDREVKLMGFSNMIASFFSGGTTIFTTQSLTHRATGANHSISVLYVSLFCLIILFFSNYIIPFIPKFIVSGILITNGLFLLDKWLIKISRKISLAEWSIIVIIFLVMIFQGFIQGVAMGLALAFLLFILNNSKMPFIRYELPGSEFISNATYPLQKLDILQKSRGKIHIIKLQGYFFFGSAERLHTHIKSQILRAREVQVKHLILDFNFVTDIDSTAIHSLIKLEKVLHDHGCYMILTGLNRRSRKHLGMATASRKKLEFIPYLKSMELTTKDGKILVFEDLDAGLEWSERQIIRKHEGDGESSVSEKSIYAHFLKTKQEIEIFQSYLREIVLKKGEKLITPEHPKKNMYFIESGLVAYLIKKRGRGYKRIRDFGPGNVIGELQFYTQVENKDMKISCIEDCTFYKLTPSKLARLEKEHPEIALKLSKWIISTVSERHNHLTQEIKYLL